MIVCEAHDQVVSTRLFPGGDVDLLSRDRPSQSVFSPMARHHTCEQHRLGHESLGVSTEVNRSSSVCSCVFAEGCGRAGRGLGPR